MARAGGGGRCGGQPGQGHVLQISFGVSLVGSNSLGWVALCSGRQEHGQKEEDRRGLIRPSW